MNSTVTQHDGPIIFDGEEGAIVDCEFCRFAHMSPLPTDSEIMEFYRSKFYQSFKPDYLAKQNEDLDWWKFTYDGLLNRLEDRIGRKGRLLDVGCGPGLLVEHAQLKGWDVVGLEPSSAAVLWAQERDLEVHEGEYSHAVAQSLGLFDGIVINQTLEHVLNPAALVQRCHNFLAPGGALSVVVANDFNPLQHLALEQLKIAPWWVQLPEHINYFTPASLGSLFESSGLIELTARMSYPLEKFLLMGIDYASNPEMGKEAHLMRKKFELSFGLGNPDLFEKVSRLNVDLALGRHVEMIGIKEK